MDQEPFDDAQGFRLATDHQSIRSVYGSYCGPCRKVSVPLPFAQVATKNRVSFFVVLADFAQNKATTTKTTKTK